MSEEEWVYLKYRQNIIDIIEVILVQEMNNWDQRKVATRIFDELHPKAVAS